MALEREQGQQQEWSRRNQRQLRAREEEARAAWERARVYMVNCAHQMMVEHRLEQWLAAVEAEPGAPAQAQAQVINFS
jgi:hypothetical protein